MLFKMHNHAKTIVKNISYSVGLAIRSFKKVNLFFRAGQNNSHHGSLLRFFERK